MHSCLQIGQPGTVEATPDKSANAPPVKSANAPPDMQQTPQDKVFLTDNALNEVKLELESVRNNIRTMLGRGLRRQRMRTVLAEVRLLRR
jgi:hypothetical protein